MACSQQFAGVAYLVHVLFHFCQCPYIGLNQRVLLSNQSFLQCPEQHAVFQDATFLRQHQLAAPATDFSATIKNCRFYATHFSFPTLLYFSIESLPFMRLLTPLNRCGHHQVRHFLIATTFRFFLSILPTSSSSLRSYHQKSPRGCVDTLGIICYYPPVVARAQSVDNIIVGALPAPLILLLLMFITHVLMKCLCIFIQVILLV